MVDPLAGLAIGRIVHYWPPLYEEVRSKPGPYAAIIIFIGDVATPGIEAPKGMASLAVFAPVPPSVGNDPVRRIDRVLFSELEEKNIWPSYPVDKDYVPEKKLVGHGGSWSWPARV